MLRGINLYRISAACAAVALAGCAWAQQPPAPAAASHIWPDQWGSLKRVSVAPIAVTDKPVWDELGLDAAESAEYTGASGSMRGEAYRLADSTAAYSAFLWQRPPDSKPSTYAAVAAETPKTLTIAFGNYLLKFEGLKPAPEELGEYYVFLPRLTKAALPPLITLLPMQSLVPNSERYIIGPETLKAFAPQIEPSLAGFHLGAEGEAARYNIGGHEMALAVFSYPTPNIARQRTEEFRKLSGTMVKRSGPLVAVVISPPDANAAEHLLSRFRYEANITWDEPPGGNPKNNVVDMLMAIFSLTGLLVLCCVGGGLLFAFVVFQRRKGFDSISADKAMVLLHLEKDR